jgi:hypothetical protein
LKGNHPTSPLIARFGANLCTPKKYILQITDKYKYLGVIFSEKKDYTINVGNLAAAGGRALGAIISKIDSLKEFGNNNYGKRLVLFISISRFQYLRILHQRRSLEGSVDS